MSDRPEPTILPIERPNCPKCKGGRMMLARIQAGAGPERNSEMRSFECPRCDYVLEQIVPDPMKSDTSGGLSGDLNHLIRDV